MLFFTVDCSTARFLEGGAGFLTSSAPQAWMSQARSDTGSLLHNLSIFQLNISSECLPLCPLPTSPFLERRFFSLFLHTSRCEALALSHSVPTRLSQSNSHIQHYTGFPVDERSVPN